MSRASVTITVGEETFTQDLTLSELVHLVATPVQETLDDSPASWGMTETDAGRFRLAKLEDWIERVDAAADRATRTERTS